MDNIQILEENATAAISPAQLTMNEFHQLNRLARLTAPYACLGCNQICESRIDGKLKVADALRYLMYHECYGDPETARLLYNALDLDERDFDRVDLAEAIKACPQGIRIDERLRKARSLLTA
jgi:predicted aldo/keto reductase-like oxidoreductase